MNSYRDVSAQQRRPDLIPLSTHMANAQQLHQTPASASSLSTPFGYNPTSYNTPVSAVRSYNPSQWASSSGGETPSRHVPRQSISRDIEAPAPPPYSPPRTQRHTESSPDPSSAISPGACISPSATFRPSPEPQANPVFAPPPGTRSRGSSRDRPMALFGLRRNKPTSPEAQQGPQEFNRDSPIAAQRPRPLAINTSRPIEIETTNFEDSRPPAARRAVSADPVTPSSASRSREHFTSRWEPGMPLPPPPPGPPPTGSRSASMSRTPDRVVSPPTRRPPPISNLGPVPPTPADWVDDTPAPPVVRERPQNPTLHIDTSSVSSSTQESNSGSISSGLSRSRAVRGESKTIRERRSESRTGRNNASAVETPSNNPWAEAITPSDIVLPASVLGRRPTINRSTPRSGKSETPGSSKTPQQSTPAPSTSGTGSRGSTPRPLASSHRKEAPTPPFSPDAYKSHFGQARGSHAIPPKSLPTPPPQSRLGIQESPRPVSHILHTPNNDIPIPPLTPARPTSRQSTASQLSPAEQFAKQAIERHNSFAQQEAAAADDTERVRIFAEFIVAESRLRRDHYSGAIDSLGSEILELTRDLFRPSASVSSRRESTNSRSSDFTPESSAAPSAGPRSHRGSLNAALHDNHQPVSRPTSAESTNNTSSGPPSPAPKGRPESQWWTGYMPSLSPIPSMSVSEAPDETDSRGRPSSRWWEVSRSGGSVGDPSTRLERHSKRESKYMGMPKELREALQYESSARSSSSVNHSNAPIAGPSTHTAYSADGYPPEKVGWHEDAPPPEMRQQPSRPLSSQNLISSPLSLPHSPAPPTPDSKSLDVSRLVTLPPPYPRHHPAVENNHPDLSSIRIIVRTLSDFTEVTAAKQRFLSTSTRLQEESAAAATKQRNSLRVNLHREIEQGNLSYADAATIESSSASDSAEKEKQLSKEIFDLFQAQVVIPLNDLLMERVTRATGLFNELKEKLFEESRDLSGNGNGVQEEGDEEPELLEKLTLLKWIWEAREGVHRELYDLLTERNERYKEMVVLPYKLAGNDAKVESATRFFDDDARKRKLAFEQESLSRTEEFLDVVEENVIRGVEVQLSAFWDIAPGLSKVIEQIPRDTHELATFRVKIPQQEYVENPGYFEHPLQYLDSLLKHAQKSSWQFIEAQINLLCLLHEVKGVVTVRNCRVVEEQRVSQGEERGVVEKEMRGVREEEERRLTGDLKEKVRCVEELWEGGLGGELREVVGRVEGVLVETGGWEEDET